jgi:hypothetical protein
MTPAWIVRLWGESGKRLLFGDVVVLTFFSALAVALVAGVSGARIGARSVGAEVEVEGRKVLTVPLGETGVREVTGPLGVTRIEFLDGQVRIISSPCPLKICQRAGWIGAAGEMIVCLPNEVVVRLPGGPARDLDAVSR